MAALPIRRNDATGQGDRRGGGQDGVKWEVVSIVGVGLIGGSFALALRKAGFSGKIIGISSPETVREALKRGAIDEALPLDQAAAQSDFIYLAQPIERILTTLDILDLHVRLGTLIPGCGQHESRDRRACVPNTIFGEGASSADIPWRARNCAAWAQADAGLVPGTSVRAYLSPDTDLESWVERIGGRLVILGAEEHDRLVALTSHLPQLVSTALAVSIAAEPGAGRVAGPAAIDLTRLALSPYEIWRDIFVTNSGPIDDALGAFIGKLEDLRKMLRDPAIERKFDLGAASARSLRKEGT